MTLKIQPQHHNESNREYAYRILKESILELFLQPGDELSEITVSKKIKLSRTPVREAFLLLEKEGLIYVKPKIGSFVSKINVNHIQSALFIRETIEKEILRLACERSNPEFLRRLKENVKAQELLVNLNSIDSFYMLDNSFHELIYEEVGQKFSWQMIQSVNYSLNRTRKLEVSAINASPNLILEHQEIISIIENNAVEKIDALLEKHLYKVFHSIPKIQNQYPDFFE